MSDTKHNGWTNYATWRVNLEFFDDGAGEYYQDAKACRDYVESVIEEQAQGIALDYALAFLSDVNWHEIAKHHEEETETEALETLKRSHRSLMRMFVVNNKEA